MVDLNERMSGAEGASVAHDPNWREFCNAIQQHWSQLPEEELAVKARRKEELAGYIHDRTGTPRSEADRLLSDISDDTGFRWR